MKGNLQKRSKKKRKPVGAAAQTAGPPGAMKQMQSQMPPSLRGMGGYDSQRDALRPGGASKPESEPASSAASSAAGGATAAVSRATFGDNTRELAENKQLSITELGSYPTAQTLPAAVEQQLLEGLRSEGWDFADLTEAYEMIDADGVTVKQITMKESGDSYTHLEFYMGDTEVGYIYEAGTTRQVAIVSDQDIFMKAELKPNRLASPAPALDPADRAHMNRRPQ